MLFHKWRLQVDSHGAEKCLLVPDNCLKGKACLLISWETTSLSYLFTFSPVICPVWPFNAAQTASHTQREKTRGSSLQQHWQMNKHGEVCLHHLALLKATESLQGFLKANFDQPEKLSGMLGGENGERLWRTADVTAEGLLSIRRAEAPSQQGTKKPGSNNSSSSRWMMSEASENEPCRYWSRGSGWREPAYLLPC